MKRRPSTLSSLKCDIQLARKLLRFTDRKWANINQYGPTYDRLIGKL